jgi:hypothetical protein
MTTDQAPLAASFPSAYRASMDQPPALPRRVAWFAPWTWRPWKRWGLAAAVLLSAYPLSIGPATWLFKHDLLPFEAFCIYHPLTDVSAQTKWSSQLWVAWLNAYQDLWWDCLP